MTLPVDLKGNTVSVDALNAVVTATGPAISSPVPGVSVYHVNNFAVNSTNLKLQKPNVAVAGLGVTHIVTGASSVGNFVGTGTYLSIESALGNTNGNYVGALCITTATSPDTAASALWAGTDTIFFTGNATNWLQIIGREIDIAVSLGGSVQDKLGLQIVETDIDAVLGSRANIGITLNNGVGATGWDCGFCAGTYAGQFPINSNGTIVGAWAHGISRNSSGDAVPSNNAGTCAYGIDFSNVTFTGAPIVMPLTTPSSSTATGKAGSIVWDTGFVYVCTATNTWKRATLSSF